MPGFAQLSRMRGALRVMPHAPTLQIKTLPPPVGGWNRRDTIPLMDVKDAITLDNWIPDTSALRLRPGYTVHATLAATATAVETLMEYSPPNTSVGKLFAATADKIWDVSVSGTASSSATLVSGLTNGRWQSDTMVNTSGTYLVAVNGADQPRMYDGSTWATCSVSATGLTRTNLIGVHNHMNRLWFMEENQSWVWYLATSAIQGVLTKFLPPFRKGGKCMAMGSWTRDGGSGPDDYSVFVSSKGECVIYAGTDPTSASTSALVGVYNIPNVIGRRCLIQAGAELGILTMQGLVPLSQVIGMSPGAAARTAFTDKISGQFKTQFQTTGTLFGWSVVEYSRGNLLIVNVPIVERSTQHQYVMNENTGAWCRFTGINGGCWAVFGTDIYIGTNDARVLKFDASRLDDTANIIGTLQHAYSTFKSPNNKAFTMARPIFNAPSAYNPPITILTDYDISAPDTTVLAASTSGTLWDTAQWDTFQWAGGSVTTLGWQGVTGEGRAASAAFSVSSSEEIFYNGTDIGFEMGSDL
jgi:hypothetical protein